MIKTEDIIKTALSEVGNKENPPSSNNVKYNTEYYGKAVSGAAYPWCCVFIWWVFSRHVPCLVKKTASCMELANWFKSKNRWFTEPKVGDIVFFKFGTNNRWTNHVGIVTKINGNIIETIEGNTSISNQDNGGSVMERQRTGNIVGYGRPEYDEVAPVQRSQYITGIDVSEFQGIIDYEKVKAAGISFVSFRSVKKNGNTDQYFERNYSECVAKKIDYSCYKYSYAMNPKDSIEEARSVIKLLANRKMRVWLDLEDKSQLILSKPAIESIARAFLEEIEKAGLECGIYCNKSWYDNQISDYLKDKYKFWIARYGKNNGNIDEKYKPSGKNIIAWQYSSKGSVPGIKGAVDVDVLL